MLFLPPHCFRGRKTAASLKQQFLEPAVCGLDVFPRSKDRGLIEAGQRGPEFQDSGLFPRSKDRGLIEAQWAPVGPPRMKSFRGRKTAASLKQSLALSNRLDTRRFRGRKTAASLKRADSGEHRAHSPRFRGRKTAAS